MHAIAAALITIAPFVGWQTGGGVNAPAFGMTWSVNRARGRELDVTAVDQHKHDVNVLSLQIGGRYIFDPDARMRPYVAATIGGTRLDVDHDVTIAPSGALGGGADLQLSRAVALRLDGRLHVTLTNAITNVQCNSSGTCASSSSGSTFTQFLASAGVVFRF
jgi:hypothetical protein